MTDGIPNRPLYFYQKDIIVSEEIKGKPCKFDDSSWSFPIEICYFVGMPDFQTQPGSHDVLRSWHSRHKATTEEMRWSTRCKSPNYSCCTSPANSKQWTMSKSGTYPNPARFCKFEQITICGYQTWLWTTPQFSQLGGSILHQKQEFASQPCLITW